MQLILVYSLLGGVLAAVAVAAYGAGHTAACKAYRHRRDLIQRMTSAWL